MGEQTIKLDDIEVQLLSLAQWKTPLEVLTETYKMLKAEIDDLHQQIIELKSHVSELEKKT
jgi:prefoldin subunit 5